MKKLRLDDRGFASAEFIFIAVVVMAIIVSFTVLISSSQDKSQTGSLGEARITGEKIAEALNTVYIRGNGYSVDLTIPDSSNPDYDITAYLDGDGNLIVNSGGQNIPIKLIAKNVQNFTMTSGHSYTVTNDGKIKIKKIK